MWRWRIYKTERETSIDTAGKTRRGGAKEPKACRGRDRGRGCGRGRDRQPQLSLRVGGLFTSGWYQAGRERRQNSQARDGGKARDTYLALHLGIVAVVYGTAGRREWLGGVVESMVVGQTELSRTALAGWL